MPCIRPSVGGIADRGQEPDDIHALLAQHVEREGRVLSAAPGEQYALGALGRHSQIAP